LKLLFSRLANLLCRECAQPVDRDSTGSVVDEIKARAKKLKDPRLVVCFPIPVPENFTEEEVESHLLAQGYTKVHSRESLDEKTSILYVIQDRFRASKVDGARISEAVEMSMNRGHGRISVFVEARCDISYGEPLPSMFSFNSPLGACDDCRGFGRVIGIDLGLVIPDESKSIAQGAVKPWQTESYKDCQRDLLKHAKKNKIDIDKPWRNLPEKHRRWVVEGDTGYKSGQWRTHWYGVKRYFGYLESKAYKMHIRVLLSKYRAYTPCLTRCPPQD